LIVDRDFTSRNHMYPFSSGCGKGSQSHSAHPVSRTDPKNVNNINMRVLSFRFMALSVLYFQ